MSSFEIIRYGRAITGSIYQRRWAIVYIKWTLLKQVGRRVLFWNPWKLYYTTV